MVTKHKKIASEIRKYGGVSVLFYNINNMKLLRRAKYILMTHGYIDMIPIDFSPGTTIFLTWHATPIKKIKIFIKIFIKYDYS